MRHALHPFAAALLFALCACGGGGGGDAALPAAAPAPTEVAQAPTQAQVQAAAPAAAPAAGPTVLQRAAAASATSESSSNACADIRPFYWEIGTREGRLAAGSLTGNTTTVRYGAGTPMPVAAASNWIYGAYVAQRGALSDDLRKFLQMGAGYVSLQACDGAQTVDECLATQSNGAYTAAADGRFDYNGGHMEKLASLQGLGAMDNLALATEIQSQIGSDIALAYSQPLLMGGLKMSPAAYAVFLRKLLGGQLAMSALLGSSPVCTNARSCDAANTMHAPIPDSESWHYSVAHWIEDDPQVGDGAFSSPGAFGFYPWIDARKSSYGIVARVAQNGAWASAQCGRLIRKAWATGVAR